MDVINIDKHILRWAKNTHSLVEEPLEGNRGQKSRVEIVYDRVKVKVVDQKDTEQTADEEDSQNSDSSTDPPNVVFKSSYKNNTTVPQQHQFTMTKETKATITSSVTKGFTRSGRVDITLSVPDSLSNVTGGFGPEVEVREEEENKVHHSLTWSVNSTVNVPPGQTTVATLIVKEVEKKFEFTAKIILRGTVLVRHVDLTTGKFKMVVQNDIATLLEDIREKQKQGTNDYDNLPSIPDTVCFRSGRVEWPIEGELNFRFGISQDVLVEPQNSRTTNPLQNARY